MVYSKNLLTFAEQTRKWSLGRVARHRSAKPFTAVRIRQRPQGKSRNPSITGLWDFLLRSSLHSESITDYILRPLCCAVIRHLIIDRISLSSKQTCSWGGHQAVSSYQLYWGLGKDLRESLSVLLEA